MDAASHARNKVALVILFLDFIYMPCEEGFLVPAVQLGMLKAICLRIVQRTGLTMMTGSLRTVWIALEQVFTLLQTPFPITEDMTLPPVSVLAMNPPVTWRSLEAVLEPIDQYIVDHVRCAATTLKDLRKFGGPGQTDTSLVLQDAELLLETVDKLVSDHVHLSPLPVMMQ